jgi:hypothetical protein
MMVVLGGYNQKFMVKWWLYQFYTRNGEKMVILGSNGIS